MVIGGQECLSKKRAKKEVKQFLFDFSSFPPSIFFERKFRRCSMEFAML